MVDKKRKYHEISNNTNETPYIQQDIKRFKEDFSFKLKEATELLSKGIEYIKKKQKLKSQKINPLKTKTIITNEMKQLLVYLRFGSLSDFSKIQLTYR